MKTHQDILVLLDAADKADAADYDLYKAAKELRLARIHAACGEIGHLFPGTWRNKCVVCGADEPRKAA